MDITKRLVWVQDPVTFVKNVQNSVGTLLKQDHQWKLAESMYIVLSEPTDFP